MYPETLTRRSRNSKKNWRLLSFRKSIMKSKRRPWMRISTRRIYRVYTCHMKKARASYLYIFMLTLRTLVSLTHYSITCDSSSKLTCWRLSIQAMVYIELPMPLKSSRIYGAPRLSWKRIAKAYTISYCRILMLFWKRTLFFVEGRWAQDRQYI